MLEGLSEILLLNKSFVFIFSEKEREKVFVNLLAGANLFSSYGTLSFETIWIFLLYIFWPFLFLFYS